MDIPDESPWGPAPDTVRIEFVDSGEITPELTVGILADIKQVQRERDAAIARAAQVQILRDMADEFNSFHNDDADPAVERALRVLILRLHGKANDLEQGAP